MGSDIEREGPECPLAHRPAARALMGQAFFRFHGALEDFVPEPLRGAALRYEFLGSPAVKDGIEALGIPHPEVGAVLVGGRAVAFDARLAGGAEIDVLPAGHPGVASAAVRVGWEPPSPRRFVLDVHLGRLAAYLRMLGFDAAWSGAADDAELARQSVAEGRILLTRDVGLLKRGEVRMGAFVRATAPASQLREMSRRFGLAERAAPFTRCLRCNAPLGAATPEAARGRVPERILQEQLALRACPSCGRVYWRGSHHAAMERLIASLG